jgi:hypothetical protein
MHYIGVLIKPIVIELKFFVPVKAEQFLKLCSGPSITNCVYMFLSFSCVQKGWEEELEGSVFKWTICKHGGKTFSWS